MIFKLEQFQRTAVDELLFSVDQARQNYAATKRRTAVGLNAPTGAGKTVMVSAFLEAMYFGDETREPDPELTVLWVTDDKSLNLQTIHKINQASDRVDLTHIRFLNEVDARVLEPGLIYFTHIHQLQRNSTLHVREGKADHRQYGAWDMIANTIRERGENFLVIWDEAHRGAASAPIHRAGS